jgi:endo-1,4-beta-xylanase
LKDYYKDYFRIGVAVAPSHLEGEEAEFIKKHFSSLTAENVMKPAPIHPEAGRYYWDNADRIVDFAVSNGLKVRGHTLVWHQQSPSWFFRNKEGKQLTKEEALALLKDHIYNVVGRYKGKVYAWDVVNEAIDDNSSKFYRETEWYKLCGKDYIALAFRWAHEADPQAKLFYNDYNTEFPGKRDKVYRLIRELLDEGVPVHGIGLQGHWNIVNPSETDLVDAIRKYASLGIEIQVTELDVSVYPSAHKDPDDDAFTPERELQQAEKYRMIFRVFREHKDVITGVTFWNVSDRQSWLDNFPVRGRKNYPLLFDQELEPKKVYYDITGF